MVEQKAVAVAGLPVVVGTGLFQCLEGGDGVLPVHSNPEFLDVSVQSCPS